MQALRIYAGPQARALLARGGLQAQSVRAIPAAAGGPKGLMLGPLDRFIFGDWLLSGNHTVDRPVHLIGASIGAWRMSTACMNDPVLALERLEHDYIHQDYVAPPGKKRPSPKQVSTVFAQGLKQFYAGRIGEILHHPRYRLHVIAARGRGLLHRDHRLTTPLGYLGAFISNAVHRKALGAWLERVVFSSGPNVVQTNSPELPFAVTDFRTRRVALCEENFQLAVQASCAIPFALQPVNHIPGAPAGAYWDGGLTDYHLHLDYRKLCGADGLVLYPHFQKNVVPGWLDKKRTSRHGATPFLDSVVVLAPDPDWVKTLPHGKLPDRTDFTHYGRDLAGRVKAWKQACAQAQQLADEFQAWLHKPDLNRVEAL